MNLCDTHLLREMIFFFPFRFFPFRFFSFNFFLFLSFFFFFLFFRVIYYKTYEYSFFSSPTYRKRLTTQNRAVGKFVYISRPYRTERMQCKKSFVSLTQTVSFEKTSQSKPLSTKCVFCTQRDDPKKMTLSLHTV